MGIKPDQPFAVTEFLKPGVEEFCSILPPWLARPILAFAERHAKFAAAHWGMEINTASLSGFLRFYILAKLRRFRPRTWRYQEEQREIGNWLKLILRAAPLSAELAIEIAECARLIKGYGDTHKRGTDNYRVIVAQVIEPALAGANAGPRRPPMRSPAPAPRRCSIPKARRWRNAWPHCRRRRPTPSPPNKQRQRRARIAASRLSPDSCGC